MTEKEVKLVIGGLLHDIGKVIYRQGDDKRKHSRSGYDYLKEEVKLPEDSEDILESVLYHHADALKNAKIKDDSLAYIVYIADNIASAADRRTNDLDDVGFEISTPLESVFNILNGNNQQYYYAPTTLEYDNNINYPTVNKVSFDESYYSKIKANLFDNLKGIEWNEEYINSLLELLEGNLTYVPSSTSKSEKADVSLFDHLKLTAAVSSCIYEYLAGKGIEDYKTELLKNEKKFFDENAFVVLSMDFSGIQDYIYQVSSENALKLLRSKSFYLEIMMEHIIDELLEKTSLSRANLIYSGGGHCYLILPNTKKIKESIEEYINYVNSWLVEQFDISLFLAYGYKECSANALNNNPEGSYRKIFREISEMISEKKSSRYNAATIKRLNNKKYVDYSRECKVCRRIDNLNDQNECKLCEQIRLFSNNILYDDVFLSVEDENEGLVLPGGSSLIGLSEEEARKYISVKNYKRAYGKNKMFTGKNISTKLWVGDYTTGDTFEKFAKSSTGIDRIGILRADVDNLGQAFMSGFEDKYATLSRTATLSRHLSLFFKYYIRHILKNGEFFLKKKDNKEKRATICYSGGDDLFIVGSWDDIIELSVDIKRSFSKYTQNTLTISAGIGIYDFGYPVKASANEVASLEEESKELPGKDAITVFNDGEKHDLPEKTNIDDGTYHWEDFTEKVVNEKLRVLQGFFDNTDEKGKALLYKILELIRNKKEPINFARYVYLLARLEPEKNATQEEKDKYSNFSKQMYKWRENKEDCRQLKTSINIYAYLTRETHQNEEGI